MDDLEGARQMGREGQTATGLSVQEQGAFDQGRRERNRAMEGLVPQGGGNGGGGLVLLMVLAPALAVPGLLVLATWTYLSETQHWEWPVLAAICAVEVVAMIWVAAKFYSVTPVVITSVVTSLYLGVSYGACMLLFAGSGIATSAFVGVGASALGYLAGLNAPTKWMSGRLITTAVAIGAGVALIVGAVALTEAVGQTFWLALVIRWSGVGLIVGALLRTIFISKWTVLAALGVGALALWQMPDFVGELTVAMLGLGPGSGF